MLPSSSLSRSQRQSTKFKVAKYFSCAFLWSWSDIKNFSGKNYTACLSRLSAYHHAKRWRMMKSVNFDIIIMKSFFCCVTQKSCLREREQFSAIFTLFPHSSLLFESIKLFYSLLNFLIWQKCSRRVKQRCGFAGWIYSHKARKAKVENEKL
jgi:hypothetical protein